MKVSKINRFYFIISYLIIGILVVSFFSVGMEVNHMDFMNSDTMYMPSIYKDLIEDGHSIEGWMFNSAPNFFPEMLIYFVVRFFSGDFLTANMVYGLVQVWIIMGLVNLIFKSLIPDRHIIISTYANLLFSICFLIIHYADVIDVPFYLTTTAYHTGAFMMQLSSIYLLIELSKSYNRSKLITLFIISLLTVFSDKIFIFYFSVPSLVLALSYLLKRKRKLALQFSFVCVGPVLLGILLFNLLKSSYYIRFISPPKNLGFQSSLDSLSVMKSQFFEYLLAYDLRSVFVFFACLSFIMIIVIAIKEMRKSFLSPGLRFYFLFILINSLLVTLVPIVAGNYIGYDTLRYNITVLYLLLFTLPLGIHILFKGWVRMVYPSWIKDLTLSVLAISLAIIGKINLDLDGLNSYLNYYPDNVRRMDEIAKKEGLKKGIGGYWSSHYITMLSRENIRIYPSYPDLTPYFHSVNTSLYFDDEAVFDFVLLDRYMDQESYGNLLNSKGEILPYEGTKVVKFPKFRFDKENKQPYFIDR